MDRNAVSERTKKLHPKIQEYINYGIGLGFFNTDNIERVIERLENIQFEVDNTIPGDAQTIPFRDGSGRFIIKQNEKRMYAKGKEPYFADEVLFHEFTHATNGLYESWFQSLDSWNMKRKIQEFMSNSEKEEFEVYSEKPEFRQAGYGWGLLDDFVAQYVAQKMVEEKYKDKEIYKIKGENYKASEPPIAYMTDMADYPVYTPFARKFIEALYGKREIERFCIESFDQNAVNNIIQVYSKRKGGLENLYKMLGYMGNIDFAENARLGHFDEGTLSQDKDFSARNPEKLYQSMTKLNSLLEFEIERAKVEVGFGVGTNPHEER